MLHSLVTYFLCILTGMDAATTALVISGAGIIISALTSFLIASARIGEYKGKVDRACTDISAIQTEQKEVRDKVISCETLITERGPLTKRKSPVVLTERGSKVLADSKGNEFVDTNYEELKGAINATKPQTSYDIQEASKAIVAVLKDDPRINPIKEYLFKSGMEWEDIIEVLGIYLRDKILKEKGIDPKDIDRHDPAKTTHADAEK